MSHTKIVLSFIFAALLLLGFFFFRSSDKAQTQTPPQREQQAQAPQTEPPRQVAAEPQVEPIQISAPAAAQPRSASKIKSRKSIPPAAQPEVPARQRAETLPSEPSEPEEKIIEPPEMPTPPTRRAEVDRVASPPSAPRPAIATLPEGTVIEVRLSEALSSARNKSDDKFEGVLDRDLMVEGKVLAPRNSKVIGKVVDVVGAGKVEGRAQMSLLLTELHVGERTYPIETSKISVEAQGDTDRDAKVIGGGAGLGALIGAVAGGKKGAAIGAAIGGGAATAGVLATKGKEVEFQPEHKFSFRLEKDVQMRLY